MHVLGRALRYLRPPAVAGGLVCVSTAAWAQFSISRSTVDGGGGVLSSGGAFTAVGTVGQPDAGRLAAGSYVLNGGFWQGGDAVSGIEDGTPQDGADPLTELPLAFKVYPAHPNPTAEQTILAFDLPEPRSVRASVYDAAGRLVRVLANEALPGGKHQRTWDRRDQAGNRVPAGIYFLRLDAGEQRSRQRVVIIH